MGDNSVDMIPPALDNGEPNSTMANQIVYSPEETILEEYFCIQISDFAGLNFCPAKMALSFGHFSFLSDKRKACAREEHSVTVEMIGNLVNTYCHHQWLFLVKCKTCNISVHYARVKVRLDSKLEQK